MPAARWRARGVYIQQGRARLTLPDLAAENREFTWVDTPDLKYSRDAMISDIPRRVDQFQRRQSGKGLSTKEAPVCGTFPYAPWRFSFCYSRTWRSQERQTASPFCMIPSANLRH